VYGCSRFTRVVQASRLFIYSFICSELRNGVLRAHDGVQRPPEQLRHLPRLRAHRRRRPHRRQPTEAYLHGRGCGLRRCAAPLPSSSPSLCSSFLLVLRLLTHKSIFASCYQALLSYSLLSYLLPPPPPPPPASPPVHTKKLDDAAKMGGLHSGPPGFRFIKFPSTYITVDLEAWAYSRPLVSST